MDLPKVIKSIRKKLNLTQAEFAKLINCSQITVSTYENGTRTPPFFKVKKLLALAKKHKVKVKLEDFLNGDD